MIPPSIGSSNNGLPINNKAITSYTNKGVASGTNTSRSQSLDQLREQVKNGSYKVDFGKLASSLLASGELDQ